MKDTQADRILRYMKDYGGITQLQATMYLGCTRLAARISDLRDRGVMISDDWVKVTNRDGSTSTVKEYRLAEG